MSPSWQLIAELWRDRTAWIWPLLVIPAAALLWCASQPVNYTASVTLQLNREQVRSPLLQDWSQRANQDVLKDVLTRPDVLADASRDGGISLVASRASLKVLNPSLLRLRYVNPTPRGLEDGLTALAYTFIYEVLAPERLRLEQQLAAQSEDLRRVELQTAQIGAPGGPALTDREGLTVQAQVLRGQYQQTLADLTAVSGGFDGNQAPALLGLAEPVRVMGPANPWRRYGGALAMGLAAGFVLAGLSILGRRQQRQACASSQNLASDTGEPLLGQLPHLGRVTLLPERAEVAVGGVVLDPSGFTELTRLHRALTRSLHGPLILTGVKSGDGVSLLAGLLAHKSAAQGKATLLIDLNLKDAALTRTFGAKPTAWKLGERPAGGKAAKGGDGWEKAIVPLSDSLHLLPAPQDAGTLASLQQGPRLMAWLDRVASAYEHIIIDTTPTLATNRHNADPLTLASAGRTALVVLTGKTPRHEVQEAAALLRQHGAHLVGVIANDRKLPDQKTLLLDFFRKLERVAPHLAQWLQAKAQRAMKA